MIIITIKYAKYFSQRWIEQMSCAASTAMCPFFSLECSILEDYRSPLMMWWFVMKEVVGVIMRHFEKSCQKKMKRASLPRRTYGFFSERTWTENRVRIVVRMKSCEEGKISWSRINNHFACGACKSQYHADSPWLCKINKRLHDV